MRAHQAELAQRVRAAASACHASLGHAQSVAWLGCVQTTLIQEPAGFPVQQEDAMVQQGVDPLGNIIHVLRFVDPG